jgi:hypothetical protein
MTAGTVAIAIGLAAGCARPPASAPPPPESPRAADALERAWRFAGAIDNDPKDRAAAQSRVALAFAAAGNPMRAIVCAREIEGWRRGEALAGTAVDLGRRGLRAEAAGLAAEARALIPVTTDWPQDRLRILIAEADAWAGDLAAVSNTFRHFESNRDYAAYAGSHLAVAYAQAGRMADAEALLAGLGTNEYYDMKNGRAQGYLEVARLPGLSPAARTAMLEEACRAADAIPDWRRWELLLAAVHLELDHGRPAAASPRLARVTAAAQTAGMPSQVQAGLLADAARAWARLGATGEVVRLRDQAVGLIERDLQNIEQPAALARVAEAEAAAGLAAEAGARMNRALEKAAALTNRRPRALAAVEICLALHRVQLDAAATGEAMAQLESTFRDAHD